MFTLPLLFFDSEAREEDNFELFAPKLEEWVQLKKEMASLIDPSKPASDVLLDEFERGVSCEYLQTLFDVREVAWIFESFFITRNSNQNSFLLSKKSRIPLLSLRQTT